MSRVARAGRYASAWFTGLMLLAAIAPQALAQGGFGAAIAPQSVLNNSPYPADWQRTNSLANMQVFNGTQETVRADIKVTLFNRGEMVAVTPNVQRLYPDGNFVVATYDLTRWETMNFTGKVGDAVDMTGRLPEGVYTICIDITNVTGMSSGAQYNEVTQCGTFVSFYPKPPTLVFPPNGGSVSSANPVFQWSPVPSEVGRLTPHLFRLVEVYPGQTPQRAIEANRAIYEDAFPRQLNDPNPAAYRSSFSYPPDAPPLVHGRRYAWRIQALYSIGTSRSGGLSNNNNLTNNVGAALISTPVRPVGENEGRSEVYTFTYAADPARGTGAGSNPLLEAPPDTRMGGVWGPQGWGPEGSGAPGGTSGSDGRTGSARFSAAPDRRMSPGESAGQNFADRLARIMASLWKQGPGAAVKFARQGAAAGSPAAGSGERVARFDSDPRVARAPEGTTSGSSGSTPQIAPSAPAPAPAEAADSAQVEAAVTTPADMPAAAPSAEAPGWGPAWARLHGTASVSGEAYSRDGYGDPTRPDRSSRVVTGLSVGVIKDQMRIPVSALFSDDQVSFRQNINQVAVAPRFRWAGLTAGNFSPQFSSYTLADATILGAGLELAPKQWQIGFVSGRARKALLPTLDGIVAPQFERNVTAGRIGYGNPLERSIEFSVMRATDDPGSIAGAESTLALTPEGNTVYAFKAQGVLPKMRQVRAQIETALSRYDRDRRADASSVDGHAVGLTLAHETGLTRIGVKAEYLNGGFMTLGNSGITGDRVDFGVNAGVQLLQGKLSLNGTAGVRNDAVSAALAAETRRRQYALNGSWQPGPRFGADAQMSVYTNESDAVDSLLLGASNTTRIYSVAPRTAWQIGRIQNSLSTSATIQKTENGGDFLDTKSLTVTGSYAAAISAPFQVTFSGNYTKTDFDISVTETSAFGPGFTLAAFRSKLLTHAQLQVVRSRTDNLGTDTDLTPRAEMRWEFAPRQAFILRANFRRFQYASPTTPEFNERIASLEYVTNL